MFFGKRTPEQELELAEQRRQKQEELIDSMRQRLEVELDIARLRVEADEIRVKLKNPEAEYRRIKNERDLQKLAPGKADSKARR